MAHVVMPLQSKHFVDALASSNDNCGTLIVLMVAVGLRSCWICIFTNAMLSVSFLQAFLVLANDVSFCIVVSSAAVLMLPAM